MTTRFEEDRRREAEGRQRRAEEAEGRRTREARERAQGTIPPMTAQLVERLPKRVTEGIVTGRIRGDLTEADKARVYPAPPTRTRVEVSDPVDVPDADLRAVLAALIDALDMKVMRNGLDGLQRSYLVEKEDRS